MILKNIVNNRVSGKYDMMFLHVTDVAEDAIYLDKFYVNEKEYKNFADNIWNNNTNRKLNYSFQYFIQKVKLLDFTNLFDLKLETANKFELIEDLNLQLKDIAIRLLENDRIIVKRFQARMTVNEYFASKKIISDDRTKVLPLLFCENIRKDTKAIFRMYNIGQGNMSALLIGEEEFPAMIFDLGRSRKCKEAINLLSNSLSSDKTTTIVISHFDNDHINMAGYLPNGNADLQFFMPEFLHQTDIYKPNIQMLLYKAIINGNNICLFFNDTVYYPVSNGCVTFYQGSSNKKDINQSTDENAHGIIVELKIHGQKVLIPGDVLYDDIFTTINNPLSPNYVIVPHHACQYLNKINPRIIDLANLKESFVFCGPHRRFHHPNLTHFRQYNSGQSIFRLAKSNNANIVFDNSKVLSDTFFNVLYNEHYDWIL